VEGDYRSHMKISPPWLLSSADELHRSVAHILEVTTQ